MNILIQFSNEIFKLLSEMAPWLLIGFSFAGILSVMVSQEKVESQIGSQGFLSNIKAVIYGIPLPLCSCGVIPVSASLKKHGASSWKGFLEPSSKEGTKNHIINLKRPIT